MYSPFLILIICAVFSLQAAVLQNIRLLGKTELPEATILEMAGLTPGASIDSVSLNQARDRLYATGCFDTLFFLTALNDDSVSVSLIVREKEKNEAFIYGGAFSLTMMGESKFWIAISPGITRRFLFHQPHSARVTVTFPYLYAVSGEYTAIGFPGSGFRSGISGSLRVQPNYTSPYYAHQALGEIYSEKELFPRLALRLSYNHEITKTWRIDMEAWKRLDWQIIIPNPSDIRDTSRLFVSYPRREQVPSVALSARYDRRNSMFYPVKGYSCFLEGRRYWVENLKNGECYPFNQLFASFKYYYPLTGRQTLASNLSFTARNRFDADKLFHRMIFYNDDIHFRGFRALAASNLLFWNVEHRFRLFEFTYDDLPPEYRFSGQAEKMARRMNYLAEAFLFADNGVLWGEVSEGEFNRRTFTEINVSRDLFTAAGLGIRVVYPKISYIAAGGFSLFHRKQNLPEDHAPMVYTALTSSF
ncbi:MAG: hypothetical protein A2293_01800 [Elusimicrobia bacterium RIFOXYB2_FULL_49_7]|nr:MAG: hypothetical protein A2293_01800 [Elusimicrobia bacterium RIFOXYB2_FULL_49_7]